MSDFVLDHDPFTTRHLEAVGVDVGWRCVDVGADGGSIARWLKQRVGPDGRVVATDANPAMLADDLEEAGIEARVHDISTDDLPGGDFDLVHSRLMLCVLPEPDVAVGRMVAALRPGGILALCDLDFTGHRPAEPTESWSRIWGTFLDRMHFGGWHPAYGSKLADLLEDHGLAEVEGEWSRRYVRGGGRTCRLTSRALERARGMMVDTGTVTDEDIDAARTLLADPAQSFFAPTLVMAWGHRSKGQP